MGYFGDKRILKVFLGDSNIYTYSEGGVAKPPYTFTEFDQGYFSANSTAENLLTSSGTTTTKWLPVIGGKSYLLSFPRSNMSRIQWKSGTTILPAVSPFGNSTADGKVITAPAGVDLVRIYFNNTGGTFGTMSIQEL